jgi:hypothetical protein
MAIDHHESRSAGLTRRFALTRFDDSPPGDLSRSNRRKAGVNRKTLVWCGLGLSAAVIVPVFVYFAPHLF